jgi:hypothetical protein
MALTSASFVPEKRAGTSTAYNEATDDASPPAPQEQVPSAHPITGTQVPQSTGAGKGKVSKGLVRGR